MRHIIIESEVEQVALDILSELKYKIIYGPDIALDFIKQRMNEEAVL